MKREKKEKISKEDLTMEKRKNEKMTRMLVDRKCLCKRDHHEKGKDVLITFKSTLMDFFHLRGK